MISYICGTVSQIGDSFIILDNNGIGYYITMPQSSLGRISSDGSEVKVYTYMAVREDDISLFGFLTKSELDMFRLLIQVSGVGPKGAVGILSSISVDELRMAIAAEDSKLIAGAKGVGSKTAQKIVVELKGKVEKEFASSVSPAQGTACAGASGAAAEAIDVLEALGFTRSAAVRAVGAVAAEEGLDASAIVSLALRIID